MAKMNPLEKAEMDVKILRLINSLYEMKELRHMDRMVMFELTGRMTSRQITFAEKRFAKAVISGETPVEAYKRIFGVN